MNRPLLFLELPFKDGNGKTVRGVSRPLPSNLKHLPRIGESIYVLPDVYLKIESIKYSGHNLQYITFVLEPISVSYQTEIEAEKDLKGKTFWQN
jgi:hypothetical protein